ncbi:MAG: hypothetical protein JWQ75_2917 [Pseudarthrobacter sp.]|nr:hypothetical protein [Pseudarthrobacter sp.]
MKRPGRVPGLIPAIGAFVLTVLLGVGGASASALWQQSATATMTVTADGTWPEPSIGGITCENSPSEKDPVLVLTLPQTSTLSVYGIRTNGTQSGTTTYTAVTGQQRIVLNSTRVFDAPIWGALTIRITTVSGPTTTVDSVTLTLESNGKKKCP